MDAPGEWVNTKGWRAGLGARNAPAAPAATKPQNYLYFNNIRSRTSVTGTGDPVGGPSTTECVTDVTNAT
jgi:hypothetical protein